jgi:hypothetical protein
MEGEGKGSEGRVGEGRERKGWERGDEYIEYS